MQITTIGLDIAKNVFQVHGIDAAEKVVRGPSGKDATGGKPHKPSRGRHNATAEGLGHWRGTSSLNNVKIPACQAGQK